MRVPRRPARRRTGLALAAMAALAVVLPGIALAATVQQLVDLAKATTYSMGCTTHASDVTCVNRLGSWKAVIKPASGPEVSLDTAAMDAAPLDGAASAWMYDMHQTACGAPKAVDNFVNVSKAAAAAITDEATLKAEYPKIVSQGCNGCHKEADGFAPRLGDSFKKLKP